MNVFATLIFASAMATAMILTVAVRGVAARVGLTDRPDGRRKLHGKPIPLGGGLAVFAANVAEGFNRSQRKYLSSLDIALGEAAEAENWLYKVRNANFLDPDTAAARIRESIRNRRRCSTAWSVPSPSTLTPNTLHLTLHPQALVDPGAIVGPGTRVWAFAHVCKARSSGRIATSATTPISRKACGWAIE